MPGTPKAKTQSPYSNKNKFNLNLGRQGKTGRLKEIREGGLKGGWSGGAGRHWNDGGSLEQKQNEKVGTKTAELQAEQKLQKQQIYNTLQTLRAKG